MKLSQIMDSKLQNFIKALNWPPKFNNVVFQNKKEAQRK